MAADRQYGSQRAGPVVVVHLEGHPDSDAEERAELAWRLEQELRELDSVDVSRIKRRPPAGAKGTAIEWAQLLVTLSGTLPPLVALLRGWAERHDGAAMTLEADGERLRLTDASQLRSGEVEAWLRRHGGA